MSDTSQGPGWWQASDLKWYPPSTRPVAPSPVQGSGPPGEGWWQATDGKWYPPQQQYPLFRMVAQMQTWDMSRSPLVAILCAAVLFIASFMPWATVSLGIVSINIDGTQGGGGATLAFALISGVLACIRLTRPDRWLMIVSAISFLIAAIISFANTVDIANAISSNYNPIYAHIGYGLWLCLISSIAGTALTTYLAIVGTKRRQVNPVIRRPDLG